MVLPQQPGRSQESEHQRRDHREEPRRQVALRLHRHLPIEHVLIARFPIRSGRDRGHRGAGGIVHLLGPGQLDERRCKIGHLHQPRLPGRRRGQQTRGLTRPQHHRRLHRRALVRSVGDGGEHHGRRPLAEAVLLLTAHPPGRFEDVPDPRVELLQRVAVGGGVAEIDEDELTVGRGLRHLRAQIRTDGGPVAHMTGGAGGGDRGTGTEGADIGHRLGQGSEGGVVVVVPGDLCVDVPIGHPAVHRRGRLAALVAGLIGRPSAGSQAQPPVDRAAGRAHAAGSDRPDLRVLHHHPQMRGRARVEVLEAEPGDIDRDHALIGRGTGRVRLSGALARRSLHGLRQTEEDERERQDAEEQPSRRRVRGTSHERTSSAPLPPAQSVPASVPGPVPEPPPLPDPSPASGFATVSSACSALSANR